MTKNSIRYILLLFGTICLICSVYLFGGNPNLCHADSKSKIDSEVWENQLNEMNYLIIRTSSINIIHGINLNKEQALALKKLAQKVEEMNVQYPDTSNSINENLVKIRRTYLRLIDQLIYKRDLDSSFKKHVFAMRELEADIIKRSVLAAQKPANKGKNCIKCHAEPQYFPTGDISGLDTRAILPFMRKIIDKSHIVGVFGEEGTRQLWEIRLEVDQILTDNQRYMLNDFRCCLLPVSDQLNPLNFGQAFKTDEWIPYFEEVRKLDDEDWKNYKILYLLPLEDVLNSSLPGIRIRHKKNILSKIEKLLTEARKMDEIDFEIYKETMCKNLNEILKVDYLNGESSRKKTERQFLTAVYLLFPGSSEVYDNIIENQLNE